MSGGGPPAGPTAAPAPVDDAIRDVGRGGMLNLVGLLVYGVTNFALVGVVTLRLGARGAGAFLVSVGVFTIAQKAAQLGAVTGLVRFIASYRATGRAHDVPAAVRTALVPVVVVSLVLALGIWTAAEPLARLFSDARDADEVAAVLRAVAPFLAVAPAYDVCIQATRGFDVMAPQVLVERVGRALYQPVAALAVTLAGGGPVAVGAAWAASFALFLVPAVVTLRRHVRAVVPAVPGSTPTDGAAVRGEFWRFTLPRSGGQLFEVGVQWADTLVVGALVGTGAAGIYAAGTRFVLLAVYVVDALIQVVGPRLSGLLANAAHREASEVLSTSAGWHTTLVWPVYLVVGVYASVLLRLLGPEFVAAESALRWLSAAVLVAALHGPSVSVILMGGRSSVALANTAVAFVLNLAGNLLLVPRYGISGAGFVWALTIVVSSTLPAVEAASLFGVRPWRRRTAAVAATAVATVGVAAVAWRVVLGDRVVALAATALTGGVAYLLLVARRVDELRLREFVGRPTTRPAVP